MRTSLNNILAAKADKDKKTGEYKWLSLAQHLKDTQDVMQYLLKEFVPPSIYTASGLSRDEFERVALFSAGVHDIGKATNAFQLKMCDTLIGYRHRLKENGISVNGGGLEDKSPHALAGAVILEHFFEVNPHICEIIASHHGKPPENGNYTKSKYQINILKTNYYSESCFEIFHNSWTEIVNAAGGVDYIKDITEVPVSAKMLLTGLLITADWIASCNDFFPLLKTYNTHVETDRASNGMKALKLQPCHNFNLSRIDKDEFRERFGFEPNLTQKRICEISNNIVNPGLMIIEVPTGQGKTEAALSAAEVLSCIAGTGGVFFGLPTRNTADSMFNRVKDWAETLSKEQQGSISLSHSSAGFNESYKALRTKTYDEEAGLSVNTWMTGKYKKLLPDFITGTVDQALFTVLKRKFLMLLHLGMAGKTVIIDEIHSYDDYMTEYLKSLLSWLGIYKVPVILLSATLTKEKRSNFISAYTGIDGYEGTDAYPAVTWTDGEKIFSEALPFDKNDRKSISLKTVKKKDTRSTLNDLLSDGGCAGVICDTVPHAQDLYKDFIDKAGNDYKVLLLHSRFLPADRAAHEKDIINAVGKDSTERNKVVVIGTQVLEQSLDIDFDVSFTEKCPIDLLFQRWGREHRHERPDRPAKMKDLVCYIFDDESSQEAAEFVYGKYIIRRTDEELSTRKSITVPDDVRGLIEAVYDMDRGSDGDDKEEYLRKRKELKRDSKCYLLPNAKKCKWKDMLSNENMGNGTGTVRHGLNSVEPILLKRNGDDYVTFSGMTIGDKRMPNEAETMELLANKISLPYSEELFMAQDQIKAWKENCYLENEHVLIGDSNGIFKIGNSKYEYTSDCGWRRL